MADDVLISLVQFAGQTTANAALTEAWQTVRRRLARLLSKGDPDKAGDVEISLEQPREQLTALGSDLPQLRGTAAEQWTRLFSDMVGGDSVLQGELGDLAAKILSELPAGSAFAVDHSVAAGRDVAITADRGGTAIGTQYLVQGLPPSGQDEQMWKLRADLYSEMYQYRGAGMMEEAPETATAQEWAIRDRLLARARVLASGKIFSLWQQSALTHYAFNEYVSDEWPDWEVPESRARMEQDADYQRLQQAVADATSELLREIQVDLGTSR